MKDYQVREGKQVAPTCSACGCRLRKHEGEHPGWYHYHNSNLYEGIGRDAKWHKCKFIFSRFVDGVAYNAKMKTNFGLTSTIHIAGWEVAQ